MAALEVQQSLVERCDLSITIRYKSSKKGGVGYMRRQALRDQLFTQNVHEVGVGRQDRLLLSAIEINSDRRRAPAVPSVVHRVQIEAGTLFQQERGCVCVCVCVLSGSGAAVIHSGS